MANAHIYVISTKFKSAIIQFSKSCDKNFKA